MILRKLSHGDRGFQYQYPNLINRPRRPINDGDWSISVFGSHDAGITIARGRKILEVVEMERFFNHKHVGLAAEPYTVASSVAMDYARVVRDYILKKYNITKFKYCFTQTTVVYVGDEKARIDSLFPADDYIHQTHHYSHAAGSFYQSPYQEALVVTADGGGNDGIFHIYHYKREEDPTFICEYKWDLGFAYASFGDFLADTRRESNIYSGILVYPGKLMGLASYGKVHPEWLDAFREYYRKDLDGEIFQVEIGKLAEATGIPFHWRDTKKHRLTGQIAYDIAATSQFVFEEMLFGVIEPYLGDYPDLPVCFAGGCALNILANTKFVQKYNRDLFVGPVPNDAGMSLGMMLNHLRPVEPFDATYIGIPLLDADMLIHYIDKPFKAPPYSVTRMDIKNLASLIVEGKIIGVARGRSELGPRALGNRSILCNPAIPDMKDILNSKVKDREWYRPFAPVVRLEDVNKYFEWDRESRWMSFAPLVREEYRALLPSITHVDNTARVQTVTREQNSFLYDLITEVGNITGLYVLLNTSFNVNGKPILTTVKDIFNILDNTRLDGAVIENMLVTKKTLS